MLSGALAVLCGIAITKADTDFNRAVLWWLAFVLCCGLVIDAKASARRFRDLLKLAGFATVCLFALLTVKFGVQYLLFSRGQAPMIILGSSIGLTQDREAQQVEISTNLANVDRAIALLAEAGTDDERHRRALAALNSLEKNRWQRHVNDIGLDDTAQSLGAYLRDVRRPSLQQELKELGSERDSAPDAVVTRSEKELIVFGLLFYGVVSLITLPAIAVALAGQRHLRSAIRGFLNVPTEQFDGAETRLQRVLGILTLVGSLAALLF